MEKEKKDVSIYFVPMRDSQYVLVCTSDEPIDVNVLQGGNTRDEIIELGQSMSSSFKSVAGGKVRMDDPLLGSIHSYVSNDEKENKELEDNIWHLMSEQFNKVRALKNESKKDYREKLDFLQELDSHFQYALEETNSANLGNADLVEDTLRLAKEMRAFGETFLKASVALEDKKQDKLNEYQAAGKDSPNVKDMIVRVPLANNRMVLMCDSNKDIDLSKLNNLQTSAQVKQVAAEMDSSFAVRGGAMYKDGEPAKPEEADMYISYESHKKILQVFGIADDTRKEFVNCYRAKYDKFDAALNSLLRKKEVADAKENSEDKSTVMGLSPEEIMILKDELTDMMNFTEDLYRRIYDYCDDLEQQVVDLAAGKNLDKEFKVENPFIAQIKTNNDELNEFRNRVNNNVKLSDLAKNFKPREVEEPQIEEDFVINNESVFEEEPVVRGIVTREIRPEEHIKAGGTMIPVTSDGETADYYIDSSVSIEEEEKPKDNRVKIVRDGEVTYLDDEKSVESDKEYYNNLKEQIKDQQKIENPEEIDYDVVSSKGVK